MGVVVEVVTVVVVVRLRLLLLDSNNEEISNNLSLVNSSGLTRADDMLLGVGLFTLKIYIKQTLTKCQ